MGSPAGPEHDARAGDGVSGGEALGGEALPCLGPAALRAAVQRHSCASLLISLPPHRTLRNQPLPAPLTNIKSSQRDALLSA
jgi:hypothetical protein